MCEYETGLLLLFAYIALLLPPFSFFLGLDTPSLSLASFMSEAVRRGSLSFSWTWRRCHGSLLLRRLVCTRRACCLFAHVTLLLFPFSLFLGVRAPSLSLGRFMNSKLLDMAHCSFSHQDQLFLLCFGFIGANSNSMNSIRRAASSLLKSLRRCLCCRARRYSSSATSVMIW